MEALRNNPVKNTLPLGSALTEYPSSPTKIPVGVPDGVFPQSQVCEKEWAIDNRQQAIIQATLQINPFVTRNDFFVFTMIIVCDLFRNNNFLGDRCSFKFETNKINAL